MSSSEDPVCGIIDSQLLMEVDVLLHIDGERDTCVVGVARVLGLHGDVGKIRPHGLVLDLLMSLAQLVELAFVEVSPDDDRGGSRWPKSC